MRGIDWVLLYQDTISGRLFNFWIDEHDKGNPAGCMPILVMDVFEHAFMHDYGLKRADYCSLRGTQCQRPYENRTLHHTLAQPEERGKFVLSVYKEITAHSVVIREVSTPQPFESTRQFALPY